MPAFWVLPEGRDFYHKSVIGTMAFVIHVTDALAPNLNGYFWAMGKWNKKRLNGQKKGECHSPLPTILPPNQNRSKSYKTNILYSTLIIGQFTIDYQLVRL